MIMSDVKVTIADRDHYVGRMLRGLAHKVSGQSAVKGAKDVFLSKHGFCVFRVASSDNASEFSDAVRTYIPNRLRRSGRTEPWQQRRSV